MAASVLAIDIQGHSLQLLAERGVYSPSERTLFVADTHFGKEATFAEYGIGVPTMTTLETLARIERMVAATEAQTLVILGDMFHARSSLAREALDALDGFFARWSELTCILVKGNHDQRVGKLPNRWPIQIVEPGELYGPWILGHDPKYAIHGSGILLCGHIHPAMRVRTTSDDLGRLACFWFYDNRLVLPAANRFAGTAVIRKTADARVWLIADDAVVAFDVARF